ncbi:type 2 isopentenyl-diphosphate Delta-isomerase [Vagococcus silagei]|uniref:Isopentenyl-diphosphate delta-isomerase n=1 Tax=Vagococcus silagei TaxID=2508885 RepID=A0A4S3B6T5_9ENTE|nr:type 2 isopentenyl-diphosphate Delta-isomerase [Vagococcus silagei]THB62368.1 type 2 isopentenyl-diphosphate Delta-isomerase [Vagococcus silagei]
MSSIWSRKDAHVHLAEMNYQAHANNGFDDVRLVHQSLTTVDIADVNLNTKIGTFDLEVPFFINAMTGGSPKTKIINQNLSRIAKECHLAMAVGSVSIALKHDDSEIRDSFTIVRKENPDGFIFSNIGAHHSLENAKRAVDLLQADALQVHLNIPQEIVMPEGDRAFSSWLHNIETLVQHLDVPVIVKEVGFGMSQETIQQLLDIGVTMIDVAGRGGTNFIQIENERREQEEFSYLYDWGQTTAESLLEAQPFLSQADFIASGGIRNPLDIIKAYSLGAKAVGLSGEILHQCLTQGNDATIATLLNWQEHLKKLMSLTGTKTIQELTKTKKVFSLELENWKKQRN